MYCIVSWPFGLRLRGMNVMWPDRRTCVQGLRSQLYVRITHSRFFSP